METQSFASEEHDAERDLREELRRVHEDRVADCSRTVDAVNLLERNLAAPFELADEGRSGRKGDGKRNDRRDRDSSADERDVDPARAKRHRIGNRDREPDPHRPREQRHEKPGLGDRRHAVDELVFETQHDRPNLRNAPPQMIEFRKNGLTAHDHDDGAREQDDRDEVRKLDGPILILPNHPGYIDPPIVITTLFPTLHPRPLLFEGNFGHNLFRYSWLWYGGFLIITRHCVEQRCQVATDGTRIEHGYESILDPSLVRNPI